MVKTATERTRAFRARKRAASDEAPDATLPYQQSSFAEFYGENLTDVQIPLDIAGIQAPDFSEFDANPKSATGAIEQIDIEGGEPGATYAGAKGAIGRAEIMVAAWLDAASELASIINRYKTQEIDRAIRELEHADLSDPSEKKRALSEIVRLSRIRDRLGKKVRRVLSEWKVKGE